MTAAVLHVFVPRIQSIKAIQLKEERLNLEFDEKMQEIGEELEETYDSDQEKIKKKMKKKSIKTTINRTHI